MVPTGTVLSLTILFMQRKSWTTTWWLEDSQCVESTDFITLFNEWATRLVHVSSAMDLFWYGSVCYSCHNSWTVGNHIKLAWEMVLSQLIFLHRSINIENLDVLCIGCASAFHKQLYPVTQLWFNPIKQSFVKNIQKVYCEFVVVPSLHF